MATWLHERTVNVPRYYSRGTRKKHNFFSASSMMFGKGDDRKKVHDFNSWTGITQLSTTCTVFRRILLQCIAAVMDPLLRQEKASSRKKRLCSYLIFVLRRIWQQPRERSSSQFIVCEKKAFDSVFQRERQSIRGR